MKKWYEYAVNGELIKDMFFENVEFSELKLMAISLSASPLIRLSIQCLQLPEKYPNEWVKENNNAFTITIIFTSVIKSNIENWDVGNIFIPIISNVNGNIYFELTDNRSNITIESEFMIIDGIHGYHDVRVD